MDETLSNNSGKTKTGQNLLESSYFDIFDRLKMGFDSYYTEQKKAVGSSFPMTQTVEINHCHKKGNRDHKANFESL